MSNKDLFNSFFTSSSFGDLSDETRLLSSLVYRQASEVVESVYGDSLIQSGLSFDNQIEATRKNLVEIIHHFNEAKIALREYVHHFPDFGEKRLENIKELRTLAKTINTERFNCNVSKLTGSSVGILGGVAMGCSLLFPPAAVVLAIGGLAASVVGGTVTFGTSVVETSLVANRIGKASHVLQEDKKQFEFMRQWFKRSQDLIDAIDKVMGYSVLQEIWDDLKNFGKDVRQLWSLKDGRLVSRLRKSIENCVNLMRHTRFAQFANLLYFIPIIITFIYVVILFHKSNSFLLNSIIISHRIAFGLMKILDVAGDVGVVICGLAAKAAGAAATELPKAGARVVAHGAFAAIGVALDLTNMVFAAIDLHKGSESSHAKNIEYVADKLEEEYEVLLSVYRECSISY